jgi:plastocyanin
MTFSTHSLARHAALALTLIACAPAFAGTLSINVSDANGQPLIDAVALLEPVVGKAVVRPGPDAEISQAKRRFSPRVTVITTGTRANFPNFDTVRHQVYSFSAIKTFELKLYAGVPGAPVTFDKPGIAVLGCNIHDSMAAWVVVADTPWYGRSAAGGQLRIEGLPPGSYKLRMWHPMMADKVEAPPATITIGAGDLEQSIRLAVTDSP